MSKWSFRSIVCSALMAGIVAIGGMGRAQAAVFSGDWDPAFTLNTSSQFANLGFAGHADFFIPDACLAGGANAGTWIGDTATCSNGGMYLIGALVYLYDLSNPNVRETLTFVPPTLNPDPILGMYVKYDATTGRNEVAGVDTTIFGPQQSGPDFAFNNLVWLQFVSGQMSAGIPPGDDDHRHHRHHRHHHHYGDWGGQGGEDPAFIFLSPLGVDCSAVPLPAGCSQSSPATDLTFTRVPEPGTLSLMVGAVVAGWAARRRRS